MNFNKCAVPGKLFCLYPLGAKTDSHNFVSYLSNKTLFI